MTIRDTLPPPPRTLADPGRVLYFVSDIHLGGSPPDREAVKRERLHALFDRVAREGASLYVLGDLFDFWFEYRTVLPRVGFSALSHLDSLARSGRPVRFLGGNHDFWIGDFLARETAIEVIPDGTRVEAQGRRFRLAHGDGLGPGDTGYKRLKRVLRNPLAIRLFRWIHPDLGIRLAMRSSHVSRETTASRAVDTETLFRTVAVPSFVDGSNALLMGHHHVPLHWTRPEGEFLMLGEWFHRYTCARLHGGVFRLLEWPLAEGLVD